MRQYASEVRSALVNAYRWAMAPFQPDPQNSSRFDMNPWSINTQDTGQIVESAFSKFIEEEALVESLSPVALAAMIEQYIWNSGRDHIGIDELWDMMTANVYMHRLRNKNVLIDCIERGVPEAKFGYADGYNPNADADQYNDMRFGEPMDEGLFGISDFERGRGFLVNPEMARLVKEEQAKRRQDADDGEVPPDDTPIATIDVINPPTGTAPTPPAGSPTPARRHSDSRKQDPSSTK